MGERWAAVGAGVVIEERVDAAQGGQSSHDARAVEEADAVATTAEAALFQNGPVPLALAPCFLSLSFSPRPRPRPPLRPSHLVIPRDKTTTACRHAHASALFFSFRQPHQFPSCPLRILTRYKINFALSRRNFPFPAASYDYASFETPTEMDD